jgi:hypothetical protein
MDAMFFHMIFYGLYEDGFILYLDRFMCLIDDIWLVTAVSIFL